MLRVAQRAPVVVAPTLNYHYYPAFVNYPGSTTLRLETARDLTLDVVRSIARHGPRRFYALNTGVSTVRALAPVQEALAKEGILFRYTNLLEAMAPIEKEVSRQARGTHADEIETSMMLYIAPDTVDMTKAVKDDSPDSPERKGPLVRHPEEQGLYSPTGTWGDPTLATREKGERVTEALVAALLRDVEAVRTAALPIAPPAPASSP
jgi:creatinine amidohydrolase